MTAESKLLFTENDPFPKESSSPDETVDVIVVGAGIVGSAVVYEYARHGWRVGVVEGGTPAGGATGAGMGHIVVIDDSPAQLALSTYSHDLWGEQIPSMPSAVEYEQTGTIWVASDGEEMAEVHRKLDVYQRRRTGPCTECGGVGRRRAQPAPRS